MSRAATFAAVLSGLLVAHNVADHWVQTGHQAGTKGRAGWPGRRACAAHVATYTATTAGAVAGLDRALGLGITPRALLAGQVISALTHYWADRRTPLEGLTRCWPLSRAGKNAFYRVGQPRVLAAWAGEPNGDDEAPVQLYEAGKDDAVDWDNPTLGTGAYALDQAWHWAWLGVAALVTAVLSSPRPAKSCAGAR